MEQNMQTIELQRLKQEIDRLYHVNPQALVMIAITDEDRRMIRDVSSMPPIGNIRGVAMFHVDAETRDGNMIIKIGDVVL